jgi:hypothetical protein
MFLKSEDNINCNVCPEEGFTFEAAEGDEGRN